MDPRLQVPTVDIRKRIPESVIDAMTQLIAERFKPQKIILFGSYAYGTPRPESDIDILVVMETPLRESQQALQIRQYLDPLFGLDVIVFTPQNLAQRVEWGDFFLKEITIRGKVLYESTDV